MTKKKVCCWDLEGPISVIDFAADIGKLLSNKSILNLENYDMGEFFRMLSNYDDYLIDIPGVKEQLGIPEYQPGDTLRIMAPLYTACYTDEELLGLAKANLGLLPGCKELMNILYADWEIFVISTSYTHFAHTVTSALNIPKDHVYCTEFNIDKIKQGLHDIETDVEQLLQGIFQVYIKKEKDLDSVINDLNKFFWKEKESDYIRVMNQVKVRGGRRKELAVEEISERTSTSISEMIALGDSITDINMLQRVNNEGGIAISFNGNRFSLKRANYAVTTPNNLGVIPIFQSGNKLNDFLEEWESKFDLFNKDPESIPDGLISKELKDLFIKYEFVPELINLNNKSSEEIKSIIARQEKMRKLVRGWAGNLG